MGKKNLIFDNSCLQSWIFLKSCFPFCSDDDDELDEKSVKSDLDSTSTNSDEEEASKFKDSHRPRNESPNSRKERKKALKAENADKRKSKVKKHIKKRKEKVASTKKK